MKVNRLSEENPIDMSIVIPVYNNWNFTKSALNDLSKLPENHEVILVNNGSDDQTVTSLQVRPPICNLPKRFVQIHCAENFGFAKACNYGFESSKGKYVCFLNNDIRVKEDHETWTNALMEAAKDGSLVGPTGGLLDDNLNFITETSEKHEGNFYISGWNLTARYDVFDSLRINDYVGPFSEEFGKAYFEDTDLGMRAKLAGINMKIVPVPVFHFGKMTSRKLNTSELYLKAKTIFKNKWTTS